MKINLATWMFGSGLCALVACGGAAGTGPTTPGGGDTGGDLGTITLRNASSYGIYSIQLAPTDSTDWGANLLGDDPLLPGEGGHVPVFECAKYSLRMVDDENAECIVHDIDLCLKDEDWSFDNTFLASCATAWAD